MKDHSSHKKILGLILAFTMMPFCFAACSSGGADDASGQTDTSGYIVSIWDEPDTYDFQCTTLHYNTAYNVFDRLVGMESGRKELAVIRPSLADSWEISEDGRSYTFHLHKGVKFSNGSPLTSSDVRYTLTRLLTHPDAVNRDIAECILGAEELRNGSANELSGFREISDTDFTITLTEPFEAFLACLSMPGASILDEETTEKAGEGFGTDVDACIGTGPFRLTEWQAGEGMLYEANPDCWSGPPECDGLDVRFEQDSESIRNMFDDGKLDIMELDDLGNAAEYYIHGDIYKDRLYEAQQVGIKYIALNESMEPLNDVRVRNALQLALDRRLLLESVYGGRGKIENGIYPHGLYGFDNDLAEIPHDRAQAASLLSRAGYPGGFDMTFTVRDSSSRKEMELVRMVADMWRQIGVNAEIKIVTDSEFMDLRKKGQIQCFEATWIADYNDPDNFAYTFFGNKANTTSRSLCYPDEETMKRVREARMIPDPEKRIEEYRDLERIIVQQDCAWIPLFSETGYYVTSERLRGFHVAWTGRYFINYRDMSVTDGK